MASPTHVMSSHHNVPQDTPITIKISVNDNVKKIKLPLKDLGPNVLLDKLRTTLGIKPEQTAVFERFSDSIGGYVTLDSNNPQVFKTLIRAAKAKLKLRLKATVSPAEVQEQVSETQDAPSTKTVEPVIVRTPIYQPSRDSMAVDRRSIGSGIFQFREARASQQTLVNTDDAPLPRPFSQSRADFFDNLAAPYASSAVLPLRSRESTSTMVNIPSPPWSVYCNECDKPMINVHFHCSICEGGDYDLCEECVAAGKLCPGEGHWLIKRFVQDGKVITSTTERISPRNKTVKTNEVEIKQEMPGTFAEDVKTLAQETELPTRTCNSCVVVLPETKFVTCTSCEDFDLCIGCHTLNKHGHHPAHAFEPATKDTTLSLAAEALLPAGRNVRHNAICDGCDKTIYGVRHKCLNCPDWDFCNDCVKAAGITHPRHRFAAIYTPLADVPINPVRHFGVYCDGPLCANKPNQSYISGVRYKCAVCHDTDFCANCEAFPGNHHNRTHPLIKLKTPVRNMSITTENEDMLGNVRTMGDRWRAAPAPQPAPSPAPAAEANLSTTVQTLAQTAPSTTLEGKDQISEDVAEVASEGEKKIREPTIEIAALKKEKARQEAQPTLVINSGEPNRAPSEVAVAGHMLNAEFVADSFKDGSVVAPCQRFTQIWTMKNPGPHAWPAGCSVRFIGGDNMLNVDNTHPAPVSDIAAASESNVVGREVFVGEEVAFKVVLKAPPRLGKAISYWRLKAADGTPFGHRLWCDILVKVPEPAQPQPIPKVVGGSSAAHMARMRQIQMQQQLAMQHQATMQHAAVQQAAMLAQQAVLRGHMEQMQQKMQQSDAAVQNPTGPPPAYGQVNENLQARLATMRAEQMRRREAMMQQFTAAAKRHHPMSQATPASLIGEEELARKEAARARVEHIKAKILRQREEQASMMEAQKTSIASTEPQVVSKPVEENTDEVTKIIEEAENHGEEDGEKEREEEEEKLEGSQMVFPKLEKESPSSSTYESATSTTGSKAKPAYVENEDGEVERSATPSAGAAHAAPALNAEQRAVTTALHLESPKTEEVNEFEEVEVLSATEGLSEDEDEDDGFLTDEEYDILDASDRETVASQ